MNSKIIGIPIVLILILSALVVTSDQTENVNCSERSSTSELNVACKLCYEYDLEYKDRCSENFYENEIFWGCIVDKNVNITYFAKAVMEMKGKNEFKIRDKMPPCRHQLRYCAYKVEENCEFNENCFQNYVNSIKQNNETLTELLKAESDKVNVIRRGPINEVTIDDINIKITDSYAETLMNETCFKYMNLNILYGTGDVREASDDEICEYGQIFGYGFDYADNILEILK